MPKSLQSAAVCVLCLALAQAWSVPALGAAFDVRRPHVNLRDRSAADSTDPWGRLVVRSTFFREMVRGAQARSCEANTPPEPLATPYPVLDSTENVKLTVSFVVGIDGRVFGPLVLEGSRDGFNVAQARPVVDAVRLWRFRPAVCNGAPTEAEAKVEFSSPRNRF